MRRVMIAVIFAVLIAGVFTGSAAADTRCCKKQNPPPTGLPATGLPLYVPVILSLGLIGTGVMLRRRTRGLLGLEAVDRTGSSRPRCRVRVTSTSSSPEP